MLIIAKGNKYGIVLMIVSSLFVCIGQLFWKLSNDNSLYYLVIGFLLYAIGALVMIYAYKFGELSVLQPILSMNYVLSIIIGSIILHEQINIINSFGVIVIISGVILLGSGEKS